MKVVHTTSWVDVENERLLNQHVNFSQHKVQLQKGKKIAFLQAPFVNSVPVGRNIAPSLQNKLLNITWLGNTEPTPSIPSQGRNPLHPLSSLEIQLCLSISGFPKPYMKTVSTEHFYRAQLGQGVGTFHPTSPSPERASAGSCEISELHLTPAGTKIWAWELISHLSLLEVWATSIFGEASRDGLCSVHLTLPLKQRSHCKAAEELHSQSLLEASRPSWLQ